VEATSQKGRATFQGIAGLSSNEPHITGTDKTLIWGRWFAEDERDTCLLPKTAAESLGITQQDMERGTASVDLLGLKLRVVGVFREDRDNGAPGMNDITDLNGEDDTLMPTTYVFTSQVRVSDFSQGGIEAAAAFEFAYLDARSVAIVPFETVLSAGGTVRSVAAAPKPNAQVDLDSFLTDLMLARSVVAYAGLLIPGSKDSDSLQSELMTKGRLKAMLYSSVGAASMKGLRNLAIPIAIAALTILNTLLGSVYEREKEIWTYSSVGLSPIHIACLFIAEACVFGVIGSVGGYLIAQVIGKLVTTNVLSIGALALTNPFFLPGLTLNFSSTSAVASVILVMLITLLSAIYPAKRAHELATPEIERRWQLAPPTSEQWRVRMPFIVRHAHVPAMNAYLFDFLDMHRQEMVGNFFVAQLSPVAPASDESLAIEFKCWLAPYDFGVSQQVRLATFPTHDEDLETFRLTLDRQSGDVQSWLRTNRAFLNELRKALLIWRTMTAEGRAHYELTAQQLFKGYCDAET
ncbi:MAG TPA: FtsX-like permease family protein, partial [bacterium]|nr:FtsX-like permease family protein [bacterium]